MRSAVLVFRVRLAMAIGLLVSGATARVRWEDGDD